MEGIYLFVYLMGNNKQNIEYHHHHHHHQQHTPSSKLSFNSLIVSCHSCELLLLLLFICSFVPNVKLWIYQYIWIILNYILNMYHEKKYDRKQNNTIRWWWWWWRLVQCVCVCGCFPFFPILHSSISIHNIITVPFKLYLLILEMKMFSLVSNSGRKTKNSNNPE